MIVRGYALPQVAADGVQTRLYPHQAAMLNEWNKRNAFLLVTKTGSGKTRATVLPVLKNHESAVFVYPTNALIQDQARSIRQLMEEEEITFREWMPQNAGGKFGTEEYVFVQVNADALSAFAKAWGMGEKQKGIALLRLLQQDKRKIVLMNPDILFLLYSLRYRASPEVLTHLQAYTTVVFDEFHLYNGVELAHALFLIHLARCTHAFQRVVLLSATPNPEVRIYLDRLLSPQVVDASVTVPQPMISQRTVAHNISLLPLPVGNDVIETVQAKIKDLSV
jgi:CRISPR-associated helicase Cas3